VAIDDDDDDDDDIDDDVLGHFITDGVGASWFLSQLKSFDTSLQSRLINLQVCSRDVEQGILFPSKHVSGSESTSGSGSGSSSAMSSSSSSVEASGHAAATEAVRAAAAVLQAANTTRASLLDAFGRWSTEALAKARVTCKGRG
jgi:hypothetical protein